MIRVHEAISAVAASLDRVRALAAEALEAGDYDELADLAGIARRLEAVVGDIGPPGHPTQERPSSGKLGGKGSRSSTAKGTEKTPKGRQAGSSRRRETEAKSQGPAFFRRGSGLIKVGRSRSSGGAYEHRAPEEVRTQLIEQLAAVGSSERLIKMDDLLPRLKAHDGSEPPSYQPYLCLAWLRNEGLVVQHGRRGYTVPDGEGLSEAAQERFEALPSKP